MTNPSITSNGVTFTFADGECEKVEVNKQGQLDENTMPASDSDGTFVVDFNGVLKTIVVTGELFDTTDSRTSSGSVMTIEQQIAWLENLVNGSQFGYTFNSRFQTNKKVYCRRFKADEEAGKPTGAPFTLELVEGM